MDFLASGWPRNAVRNRSSRAISSLAALLLMCAAGVTLAEDWQLKDTEGVSHTLAGEKGKWVLVNFWAPWCPPCLEEMPGFNALQRQHRDLQVIGVAVMYRRKSDVLAVVSEQKLAYPIVLGNESVASDFGGFPGLPTSFLYDPAGKLVGRHEGPLTPQEVERVMSHAPDAKSLFVSVD